MITKQALLDKVDDNKKELYKKWKSLVNMTPSQLQSYYDSSAGKSSGLSRSSARSQGIKSGRDSAKAILRMKNKPVEQWTPSDWSWAKRQVSFISRMKGGRGDSFKDGKPTRKLQSLLIWGHNPGVDIGKVKNHFDK